MNSNILSPSTNTWRNQGPTQQSAETYRRVQNAINAHSFPAGYSYAIHLQGSYKNSTNIRGDSDVDVVAVLTGSFRHGAQGLPDGERAAFSRDFSDSDRTLAVFKAHVITALRDAFGDRVSVAKKCINVGGEGERLNADVLACQSYRKYNSYRTAYSPDYVSGIEFWIEAEKRWVVNYPKQHYERGVQKNDRCSGNYKPMVRYVKNARNYLVDHGELRYGITPSYFVEGWLSNLPDWAFTADSQESFKLIVGSLANDYKEGRMEMYYCQNGQSLLFGPTPEQWDMDSALTTLAALIKLLKA
ncbi:MAG: hypothetical protein AKCLJLPJ_01101 [Fimbriimonadales bacterium]|nr:hypothetical protein [Fimbriimonadales bacterium]